MTRDRSEAVEWLARFEGAGLDGVPDRAAVNVRRARERLRRVVVSTTESQVGSLAPDDID